MKTVKQALLDHHEICSEDTRMSVKDFVLRETDKAKCIKSQYHYSIKSEGTILGRGETEDRAWEDAAVNFLK